MELGRTSQLTGNYHMLEIPIREYEFTEAYYAWKRGAYIQDAFHMLDTNMREFIMTGITPQEWRDTFGYADIEHRPIVFVEQEEYMIPMYWDKRAKELELESKDYNCFDDDYDEMFFDDQYWFRPQD